MKLFIKRFLNLLKLILVAWMLGVSNVVLEEDRMVHDTRLKIEYQEEYSDSDLNEDDTISL
ncbi:hypothetical protein [Winogradskyella aurantiaca]|uniref:hypothetical protein n=1 Tax=Winogradskyella aurantiaca TaxID=2219558 RepID=UPI001300A17E|nr:hypothetical protein [Winogradskyella aurantiaca]